MTLRIAPILLLFLILVGCGDGVQEEFSEGRGGKKYGGAYTLNVVRGNPNGLDPVLINSKHADDIASQIYDKLIDLNDKLELVPELATDLPELHENGRIYTFHLRTGVDFQDNPCFPTGRGRRMTAGDVKYSLTRCCDPRTRTVASWAFLGKVVGARAYHDSILANNPIEEVSGFRVLNDSTFQIELERPYAPFIYCLVNSLGSIVPREAVEKYGPDFFQNPVGTGPFVLDYWKHNTELVLKKNPNYWGTDRHRNKLPFLNEVRFLFIKDDKVQLNEFTAGKLDENMGIPTETFPDIINVETGEPNEEYLNSYQVQMSPAMLTWFFDFNTQKPPFDNADLRRAFNYAIDREKIVRFVLQNSPYAPAVHGIVPPVFADYPVNSIEGYSYDPEKAREHLARAGYADGAGLPEIEMHIYPEPRLQQVAQAMEEMLETNLKVRVAIRVTDFPQLIGQAEMGALGFWGTRWYGDYPDPETYLHLLYGKQVPDSDTLPSYPNSTRYKNPKFDELFELGVGTIDHMAQVRHYAQAEQIAINDAPMIPLFYEQYYRLLQPYVQGRPLDPMDRTDLKYVWLDK